MNRRGSLTVLAFASAMGMMAGSARAVDDLSLVVDPGSECVSTGETITIRLNVANLSAAINGAQVRLNYNTSLMTLVSITPTDLGLSAPAEGWVEVNETDSAGNIDYAVVINGGSILINHTIATLTFLAEADGTADLVFRPDADPFFTKLTRASDSGTILPNKIDSGFAFIGPPDCTITADNEVCADTAGHVAFVPDAGLGATYNWVVTGGTITAGQGTSSITYTAGAGATVTIDVTVTDGDGCSSQCQKIVTVNANPVCLITAADSVCAGSTGNPASVPDAGLGATYDWVVTGGTITSGLGTNAITFTAGMSGTVTVDVQIIDANGCTSSCQKIIDVAAPDCTITADDEVCADTTGHVASVPDAGGGAAYTWVVTGGTLTGGQGTTSITYTAAAGATVTLDVTVTGGDACESSCQKIVTINANPDCTITADAEVCAGTTGHVASVPNAGGGATYAWVVTGGSITGGQGTSSITYTAGTGPTITIDVTVTDANGCVSICQEIVVVNDNPDCTITADAEVCADTAGHLASVPDAGLGATYDWVVTGGSITGGQGTSSITYTAGAGPTITIDVTVTDANGCVSVCQEIVVVNDNPDCTITAPDAVCDGSTGNLASVPDAGLGATYDWVVTGGSITSGLGTSSITFDAGAGPTLTIDVTATDANGCVSVCQKIVSVDTNPTCSVTADDEVCDGTGGHVATVGDAGVGAIYDWAISGGTIDSGQGTNSITYTAGAGPTVTLDVTVTDAGGCISTCQKIVLVNPNPDCTITADAEVCADTGGHGASVPDAGVGATYAWSVTGGTITGGQGTSSITYSAGAGASLTIEVTVTDANGCVSTCQTVVTILANPDCTITAADEVCDGSTGNAASVPDAGLGATYAWVVTGGTITGGQGTSSITYTATDPLLVTIDVTVTDADGCVSDCQKLVLVNANPDCTISAADEVCDGSTGNAASVADAGPGATYDWVVTGGTITGGLGTSSITYTASNPTSITIDVVVTDGNGCVSVCQKLVSVNPNPDCTITADAEVCAGTSGHSASVPDAGVGATYAWSVTGGTLTGGQGTTSITYTAGAGPTVTLSVTVTDANGCVSSCQEFVVVNDNPDCTITADALVCANSTGNLASVPDAGLGATYDWVVTGGTITGGQGTASLTYSAGTGTSLTIDVTVTDANGCVSSCQQVVTVNAPSCTISSASTVCFQSVGNFATVADAGAGATYNWTVTGGTLTGGQGTNEITYTAGSGTSVTLEVTVTNNNGCVNTCQRVVTIQQPSINVTLQLQAVSNVVTRDVTFVITECGGSMDTRVVPVTTDATGVGSVTLTATSIDADWISMQEGHTLRRLAAVTYGTCSVATVTRTGANALPSGDFHTASVPQDNLVDIVDFSILASRWNQLIDPNSSTGADATGDGVQNSDDFTAIQVNYFTVGEALDGCPVLAGSEGGLEGTIREIESDPLQPVSTEPVRQASGRILVHEAGIPNARLADLNGDGVIDAKDIRAFAELYDLPLLPEFQRKLEQWERSMEPKRRDRSLRGSK